MNPFLEALPVPKYKVMELEARVWDLIKRIQGNESDLFNLVKSGYLDVRYEERNDWALKKAEEVHNGLVWRHQHGYSTSMQAYNAMMELVRESEAHVRDVEVAIEAAKGRASKDENPFQRWTKDTKQAVGDALDDAAEAAGGAVAAAGDALSGAGGGIASFLQNPAMLGAGLVVLILVMVVFK